MAALEGNDMDVCGEETRALIAGDAPLEGSFIDLIVAASECSEDEAEIFDLIEGLLDSGRVELSQTPGA
jgi:hypothetical protein